MLMNILHTWRIWVRSSIIYPLANVYVAIENSHIEIVDLPMTNGDFPVRYVNVYWSVWWTSWPSTSPAAAASFSPMVSGRGFVRGCRLWGRGPTGRKNDRPGGLGKWLNWTRCCLFFWVLSNQEQQKKWWTYLITVTCCLPVTFWWLVDIFVYTYIYITILSTFSLILDLLNASKTL